MYNHNKSSDEPRSRLSMKARTEIKSHEPQQPMRNPGQLPKKSKQSPLYESKQLFQRNNVSPFTLSTQSGANSERVSLCSMTSLESIGSSLNLISAVEAICYISDELFGLVRMGLSSMTNLGTVELIILNKKEMIMIRLPLEPTLQNIRLRQCQLEFYDDYERLWCLAFSSDSDQRKLVDSMRRLVLDVGKTCPKPSLEPASPTDAAAKNNPINSHRYIEKITKSALLGPQQLDGNETESQQVPAPVEEAAFVASAVEWTPIIFVGARCCRQMVYMGHVEICLCRSSAYILLVLFKENKDVLVAVRLRRELKNMNLGKDYIVFEDIKKCFWTLYMESAQQQEDLFKAMESLGLDVQLAVNLGMAMQKLFEYQSQKQPVESETQVLYNTSMSSKKVTQPTWTKKLATKNLKQLVVKDDSPNCSQCKALIEKKAEFVLKLKDLIAQYEQS